ncbi:MAG: SdrD B-like domain-containing protein [Flexilinea sp.]
MKRIKENRMVFRKTIVLYTAVFFFAAVFIRTYTADASADFQTLVSPTPDFDGKILYTVTENDTCLSVSLKMGVDISVIQDLNNLDEDCTLISGTQILLGIYSTPTPTAGPSPTPTEVLPTPTPFKGNAQLCIYLFEDINGNSTAEATETGIGGGAVSVTKRGGSENFTGLTTGIDLLCFSEVPEGEYNISVAPPNEYNATTNMNYPITIQAGDTTQVNFGAQKQAAFEETGTTVEGTRRSPIIAILGIGLMLCGVVIVIIFGILKRRA